MTTELARIDPEDVTVPDVADVKAALAHYLVTGDVSRMPGEHRLALYYEICRSIHINPRTRPLEFIEFYDPQTKGKKLTLYPTHAAADQLAYLHRIRIRQVEEKTVGTLYKLRLEGTMPDGRTEENVAYLSLTDQQGQLLVGQRYGDALMKCFTKAKRRLVFGMVGFNVPVAAEALERGRRVLLDAGGNVMEHPSREERHLAVHPEQARIIGAPTWEDTVMPMPGLADMPDTAPQPDPGPPRRDGPAPTFRPSAEQVDAWRKRWHASVTGTSLAAADERHRFIAAYTGGHHHGLTTLLPTLTERQADDLLGYAQVLADEERAAIAASSQPDDDDEPLAADERPF